MPLTSPAAPSLQRLIYYSQATPDAAATVDLVLQDIVQASIRNNHDAAVTGYLIAHQGWFLQALEGPKAAVAATFDRIIADPRHTAPKIIISRVAEQRCFASWTLCARRLTPADDATLALFDQRHQFQPHKLTARRALALLMTASQSQKPAKSILWLS